ncbi:isochorismate synthase [Eudoraea chungangensis]|uniref:isochorismate synthase n=1 Tax=Eudoraea chungangensis TaxID=1481905 RepID=UPI0023EAFC5E|nr:isochorismate synthase [Eudoraea chungangensis]
MLPEFFKRIESQLRKELPFVCYRKPGEKTIRAIYQHSNALITCPKLDRVGFVFAPFSKDYETVLIPRDEVSVASFDKVKAKYKKLKILEAKESGEEAYIELIKTAIRNIQTQNLKKVVLSRAIDLDAKLNALAVFQNILSTYDNAFCYLWFHPKIGLWLGATPELLFSLKNGSLTSMSLAGTMPWDTSENPSWGAKEKEEQQLVTAHISNQLENKLEDLEVGPQETVKAGNLWHLKSTISGTSKTNSLLDLVCQLHPTPAVCGLPVAESTSFIMRYEGYNREYYAGFLGEIESISPAETSLFVNLRCLKQTDTGIKIFVGGGITEKSVPELEWLETIHKSKTMLNMLRY